MKVIDLRGKQGQFETDPLTPTTDGRSRRRFGVWSFDTLVPGDYVIRPLNSTSTSYSLLKIIEVDPKPFTGSNHNRFWNGVMEEVDLKTLPEDKAFVDWDRKAKVIWAW